MRYDTCHVTYRCQSGYDLSRIKNSFKEQFSISNIHKELKQFVLLFPTKSKNQFVYENCMICDFEWCPKCCNNRCRFIKCECSYVSLTPHDICIQVKRFEYIFAYRSSGEELENCLKESLNRLQVRYILHKIYVPVTGKFCVVLKFT